jgi:alpha-tubulin suppressor-like RCC1 family protein
MKEKWEKVWSLMMVICLVLGGIVLPEGKSMAAGSEKVKAVSLGGSHSAAIKEDGSLWLWGSGYDGRLGDGTTNHTHRPVKILDGVKAVNLGSGHSAAIKEDGSLWLWGDNNQGQLGDGTREDKERPVKILDGVKSVSLGEAHSAAIKEDGSLWLWGKNSSGQLGDGTRDNKERPVKVLEGVKSISLGFYHSAAIKEDGSLWLWGDNKNGQLGDGTEEGKKRPIKILEGVQKVSVGEEHSAAIKEDGSLWLWGDNNQGQLGDGTREDKERPVKILDGVKAVNLGDFYSATIKEDGSLWLWGHNFYGELGDGTLEEKECPVKILDRVKSVSLGEAHSAAIKEDGSLWLWGHNLFGELGDGTTTDKLVPVQLIFEGSSAGTPPASEFFVLGRDNNQFVHTGFPYAIENASYVNRLIRDSMLTWYDTLVIAMELNNPESQGVCHGIALSMCYGNQDMVAYEKLKKGADCYWKLGNPKDSEAFRDLIVYYQLTQHTANGKPTKTLDREGWHLTSLEKRKKEFLQSLVAEAKRGQNEKKPFVFSFLYGTGGHSIVACGYRWNETSGQHEIILYDENSYPNAVYYTMTVSGDYSSFQFADANHRINGKKLEDTWTSLKYFGIDRTYHGISTVRTFLAGGSSGRTTVQVPIGKKFRLENDKGEWLEYDGAAYTGNMKVYDCVSVGMENDPDWSLTVDASDRFSMTKLDKGCTLICKIEGKGYGVTADGAKSVLITENGLDIQGNQYHLDLTVQLEGQDFVRMDTDITGDAKVTKNGENVQIQAEGSCENTKISVYDNGGIQKETVLSPGKTVGYGESEKPAEPLQKGKTYNAGKFNYKVTSLSKNRGSVTLISPRTKSLTTAVVPDTVTIKGATLKVTAIGDKAFQGCGKLKSVNIGKYVTKIGKEAFAGDKKLTSIKVQTSSLKTVGSSAFRGISKKAVVSVPKSKLKAYKKFFSKKTGFASTMKLKAASSKKVWKVTFKNGSKTVKTQKVADGKAALAPKLKKKGYVLSWNTSFSRVKKNLTVKAVWTPELPKKGYKKSINGIMYQVTKSAKKNGTVQVVKATDKTKGSYVVPSAVKIGKYSFKVTGIGKSAFLNCKKAKTIRLPGEIKTIGKGAFKGTFSKLQVSVPKASYSRLSKQLRKAGLPKQAKVVT